MAAGLGGRWGWWVVVVVGVVSKVRAGKFLETCLC